MRKTILGLFACLCVSMGARAGSFTIITDPHAATDTPPFIQLLGINNAGTIVGYTGSGSPNPNRGFILTPPSSFTDLNPDLTSGFTNAQTQVFGITDAGTTTAGFVIDSNGVTHGFVDAGNGATATTVDDPIAVSNASPANNQLLGLNRQGTEAAGFYTDAAGLDHGYVYNVGPGTFMNLDLPASVGFSAGDSVQATGVNDKGMVSGFFVAGANATGFLFNGTSYQIIQYPGSTFTQPLSLNDLGQVVGTYTGADGVGHGFLYSSGVYTTIDGVAGAPMNLVQGINDHGQLVGFAVVDAAGTTVGFEGTVPEPSTVMLAGFGVLALAVSRKFAQRRASRNLED